jgi:hypothetical protein
VGRGDVAEKVAPILFEIAVDVRNHFAFRNEYLSKTLDRAKIDLFNLTGNDSSMTPANIAAAQRFVDFATVGAIPPITAIAQCLDELALSYHDTPAGDPNESDDNPPSEIRATRADIAARFPNLGLSGTVFGIDVPGEAIVADAIDDILDITNDLKEVLWRYDRFGAEDAHWYFRMLFEIHWGEHLRGLAGYLYWRMRDEIFS